MRDYSKLETEKIYRKMEEITHEDYLEFIKDKRWKSGSIKLIES